MHSNELIGIAAPQIGYNYKIFVTHPRETKWRPKDQADDLRIYINPKITYSSKRENIIYEGCGCVLDGKLMGPVKRPASISVVAYEPNKSKFQLDCDGILGRVIQHEYDHMFGIEFTEKICDYKKLMYVDFYIKFIKESKKHKKASEITKVNFKEL